MTEYEAAAGVRIRRTVGMNPSRSELDNASFDLCEGCGDDLVEWVRA
jgi:hypothetical protein